MADFKKTMAAAKAKIAKAELEAFAARDEAIVAILRDATPHDVLALCAHAIAAVAPDCCEAHRDEFKAEFLRILSDCIAMQEAREADADENDDVHQVH